MPARLLPNLATWHPHELHARGARAHDAGFGVFKHQAPFRGHAHSPRGEQDTVTPPSCAESLHAKIPGSDLHAVPGAAHMSNLENPAFFNATLLAFLKRSIPTT